MEQKAIYELLAQKLGPEALSFHDEGIEPYAEVTPGRIHAAAQFLRDDERLAFKQLMCLTGIDWDGYDESGKGKSVAILGYTDEGRAETSDRVAEGDFGVVYSLYSHQHGHKFTMRVRVPRTLAEVPTVSDVWATANWHEREVWDLVGIRFTGHPNLCRMLMEDHWVGHPLRKDYEMPEEWDGAPLGGRPLNVNPFPKAEDPTPGGPPTGGDSPAEG